MCKIMTHIGYIHTYHANERKGIVIDSHRFAHIFSSVEGHHFTRFQFVTYEGEGEIVEDVIALESYPLYRTIQKDKTFYIQDGSGSWYKYYLVNKRGERYTIDGPEAFIIKMLFHKKSLEPSNVNIYSEDEYKNEVNKIFEIVDFVSSHLNEIANSYKVRIKINHITKIGGDDSFYIDRHVELSYRDNYINRFFLCDENLYSDRGYTSHFEHSYKEGRQFEEEKKAINSFLSEYDKKEHLSVLLYSLNQKLTNSLEHTMNINIRYAVNWGLRKPNKGFDNEGIYYKDLIIGPNITLDTIRDYNAEGMHKLE